MKDIEQILLPYDLVSTPSGEVFAMSYQSEKERYRSRIVLDWHLFSFLLEGEKTVSYASGTQRITPTSFFFLPSGNCLMTEKTATNGSYKSIVLFVTTKALSNFFKQHMYNATTPVKISHALEKSPKAFARDAYLDNVVRGFELIAKGTAPKNHTLYELKLGELMLYLLDRDPSLISYFKGLCNEADEEAQLRQVINTHVDTSMTVEELAFLCNMSVSTFKRKFAKVFGTSPKQWFLKMRMQKAAELLGNKNTKPGEIYYTLGYENFSSFVQSFKQVHGITPKQFQLREN